MHVCTHRPFFSVAIIPIIISLFDIKWGSVPAITIYLIGSVVVGLLFYQVFKAGGAERELINFEDRHSTGVLEDRKDFVLEEINAWVVRHRLVDDIIGELSEEVDKDQNPIRTLEIKEKLIRYKDILLDCEHYVGGIIKASETLVKEKKRSREDHEELLDWVAAIPNFTRKKGDDAKL